MPQDSPAGRSPRRVGVLRDQAVAQALSPLPAVVDRFDEVESLVEQGRRLQPRVCVLGPSESAADVVRLTRELRAQLPFTDVLLWHPEAPAALVQDALRAGVRRVVLEQAPEQLTAAVEETLEEQTLLPAMLEREQRQGGTWRFEGLVSRSRRMWDIFETCIRTAETDASILILGETGTGKDLVARAIHRRSKRGGRYVAVDCGAVPDTLIDSELFGHVRGAFSGADRAKEGLFRYADRGTLFLDEIGNVPLSAQNRLLRVLQSREVRPVGGHEQVPVDVRVIAATSASLEEEIQEGRFREDLLYRLDVIRLVIPPLRERPEDVIFLFGMFAQQLAEDYQLPRPEISEGFLQAIAGHAWPGNVRELENFTERLILSHAGRQLEAAHFEELQQDLPGSGGEARATTPASVATARQASMDLDTPLPELLAEVERDVELAYLEALMAWSEGRIGRAADRAGIHRRTLLRKLQRHGLEKRDFRPGAPARQPGLGRRPGSA